MTYYHIKFGEKIGYFDYDSSRNKLFLMGLDYNKNISRISAYSFPDNEPFKFGKQKNFRIGMTWFEVLGEVSEIPNDFEAKQAEDHSYWKIKFDGNVRYFEYEEIKYAGRSISRKFVEVIRNSNNSVCRQREYAIPGKVNIKSGEKFYQESHEFELIEIVKTLPKSFA